MEEIKLIDGRKIVIDKWNDMTFAIKEITEGGNNLNTLILPCDFVDEFTEKIEKEVKQ